MKLIDLTHTISPTMPVYPGTEPPIFQIPCTIDKDGFKETEMKFYSHTGTHMDSPGHIFYNGKSINDFSIEHFYGKGIVVDCRDISYGKEITKEHIKHLKYDLEKFDFVLFYTGWDKKWGKNEYFKGFPTLSLGLAETLSKLNIKGVGIDTISIEPISSESLEVHHRILKEEKIILENLKNLNLILEKEFFIFAMPLKIENLDGSPVRAVAFIR